MDPMKTHGAFSWCELMTPNTKAAADFYHQLFGWNLQTLDMPGGPYHVVKIGEAAIAGIMSMPADAAPKMPPHWGCYITVDNADESAAEAQALGAKVIVAPTDVPGVGRFAVLQDPQGAVFSIIDYLDD